MRKIRGDFCYFGFTTSPAEKTFEPVARRGNCFQLLRWMLVKRQHLRTSP